MDIKKYLKDNTIFVVANNFKNTLLKIINENTLLNIKIITLDELKRKLIFNYDEKTIYYLIKEKNISYSNAIEYLESLYYLTDKLNNSKLKELYNLKEILKKNKLLIYDEFFSKSLIDKDIYLVGFDYLSKFDLFLINKIKNLTKVNLINEENKNYEHNVLKFKNINYEIEYIANEIIKKIKSGISLNNIYIANYSLEYNLTIKRVFEFYKIPINLNSESSIYDTKIGLEILNNLDNYENVLNKILDSDLYNDIIEIFNKYYWTDDFKGIKDILIEEFKNKKILSPKYKNAVNLIDLKNNPINDHEHIFLLGFADGFIPKVYKDDNLINDKEKNELLENTEELNKIEKEIWYKIIRRIKNLTISYAEHGLKGVIYPSPLTATMVVKNLDYNASLFSHKSNKFNLALLLDDQIKYGTYNQELNKLSYTYNNLKTCTYKNQYKKINPELIKNYYQNGLNLSYTKINTYYECAFKYYLDYILKLNNYEETFEAYLGNLCHYILSKTYDFNFNLLNIKEQFLNKYHFDLTEENYIFIDKMCEELEFAIEQLKEHFNKTYFKKIECEKNIKIEKNNNIQIIFTGIIDKIMRYQNKIAIIDYKTYSPNIDLSLVNYGLKMQLPFYIYLIKNYYPDIKIAGIYLQPITRNVIAFDQKKNIDEIRKDNLKLVGYTIDNENIIAEFDQTYKTSKFIKGMSLTTKGFNRFTKLLQENDFDALANIADNIINDAAENILNANFDINPKILDKTNLSCIYCKYKSICFVNYDNYIQIFADKNLTFLGRDNNDDLD